MLIVQVDVRSSNLGEGHVQKWGLDRHSFEQSVPIQCRQQVLVWVQCHIHLLDADFVGNLRTCCLFAT